jgi:hypothetical protein
MRVSSLERMEGLSELLAQTLTLARASNDASFYHTSAVKTNYDDGARIRFVLSA